MPCGDFVNSAKWQPSYCPNASFSSQILVYTRVWHCRLASTDQYFVGPNAIYIRILSLLVSSWQTDDFRLVPLAAPIGDSFRNLRSLVFSNSCHGLHLQENSSIQPWAQESFFRCGRAYAPTEASGTFLWFDMFIHVFGIARSSYGSTTDWNLATSKIGESPLNQGSSVCFSFQDDKSWINYISEPHNIHGVIRLFPCIFTTRPWWIGACATYGESVTPSPDGSEASHFQGVVLFIVGCDLFCASLTIKFCCL